ncbi:aminotransferase class IV [Tautonia sociabilis]|uniref:Aminotransferase IV n=1 Tax=Tautonia sociabilis TaxID=2080755 RepID=A0A432MP50_9BACT|nr:aminotransferase class IV [Tautonia sociabilis]RUL89214.1 aminotransferase IV [Tautonia sociabilis]
MHPEPLACLNGERMPASEAKIPIWDRGFLFGDAVYEVMRLYAGRMWLEREHMDRLRRSVRELKIEGVDFDRLRDRIDRTIAASGIEEGTVYIQISRGVAPRRHRFPEPGTPPTELIVVGPYDDSATAERRKTGVPLVSAPDLRWKRCDVKSVNLLGNVLANEEAHRADCIEAVLVNPDGVVTEATHSSLLWVRAGRLEGTPEGPGILPGTSRGFILRLARSLGLPFAEAEVTLDELKEADEVLLSGTTLEIVPVTRIDGKPIGDGQPGPIGRSLVEGFAGAISRFRLGDEPIPGASPAPEPAVEA